MIIENARLLADFYGMDHKNSYSLAWSGIDPSTMDALLLPLERIIYPDKTETSITADEVKATIAILRDLGQRMEKAQQLTVKIKYKKYIIVIISAIFFGNIAKAQLLRLPANVKKEFGRALRDQLNSPVDSVKQVSFDLIVELKLVDNDSTIVEKVTQLNGDNVVQYLNNTDFVKTCNFYKFMRGRKTIKIHIPFFIALLIELMRKL